MSSKCFVLVAACILAVSSAENQDCHLRAKNGCNPINPTWKTWDTKILQKPSAAACRSSLKFWMAQCQHHVSATFGHEMIFVQQTERYTSTCSHVHCTVDASSGRPTTLVHHHHAEQFGHKAICKHGLHVVNKVSSHEYLNSQKKQPNCQRNQRLKGRQAIETERSKEGLNLGNTESNYCSTIVQY